VIDRLAREGDPSAVKFTRAKISDGRPDFSFSGLKTAVARHLRETGILPVGEDGIATREIIDLAASFQSAVVGALTETTRRQALELNVRTIVVGGGVAGNTALREACGKIGRELRVPVYFPSKHLSTDNAAMIAAAGYFHIARGEYSAMDISADVGMRLQNLDNEDASLRRNKVRYRL
jgi:N6-L-threonylcarbamoyladenine synthase